MDIFIIAKQAPDVNKKTRQKIVDFLKLATYTGTVRQVPETWLNHKKGMLQ
ncbi:TPA: hypothetical protein KKW48_003126 [Legionella pneumophila]|nr:hypothetical protein [Legionella pneumophila]